MGFTLEGALSFKADRTADSPAADSDGDDGHLLLHGHDISEGFFSDENIPNTPEVPPGRSRRAMLVSTGRDPFVLISSSMMIVKDHLKDQLGIHRSGGKDETAYTGVSDTKMNPIKKKAKPLSRSKTTNILQRTAALERNQKRGLGPSFTDYFGWCTWDSFYTDLSSNRVLSGLESFKGTGVRPRFLILDDGWQVHGVGNIISYS
jgi:Raffinose synthase or seed imbibition protein Sip1